MLRNFDILTGDPEAGARLYFRQCSVASTAATCADGGDARQRRRQSRHRRPRGAASVVDNMLSVMTTCGMYDFAGEWVYRVGMPAKSGVAGGVLAVLPGQLGIGVFSPAAGRRAATACAASPSASELSRRLRPAHFDASRRAVRSILLATTRRTSRRSGSAASEAGGTPSHRATGFAYTTCRGTWRSSVETRRARADGPRAGHGILHRQPASPVSMPPPRPARATRDELLPPGMTLVFAQASCSSYAARRRAWPRAFLPRRFALERGETS